MINILSLTEEVYSLQKVNNIATVIKQHQINSTLRSPPQPALIREQYMLFLY